MERSWTITIGTAICSCGWIMRQDDMGRLACTKPKCEEFGVLYQPQIKMLPVMEPRTT